MTLPHELVNLIVQYDHHPVIEGDSTYDGEWANGVKVGFRLD
jgi:hypothetical protein